MFKTSAGFKIEAFKIISKFELQNSKFKIKTTINSSFKI